MTMMNEKQREMCRHCRLKPIHNCLQNEFDAYFPSLQTPAFILHFFFYFSIILNGTNVQMSPWWACNKRGKELSTY